MLAAAEVAVERVDQLFVIKHILATSKAYLDKLKDKNNRNMAELYHAMIWEVHQTLANRSKPFDDFDRDLFLKFQEFSLAFKF